MGCANAVLSTAAALYSGMTPEELRRTGRADARRALRPVFVAPERLLTPRFLQLVERLETTRLRHRRSPLHQPLGPRLSPRISSIRESQETLSAGERARHTATATERVRADIAAQLRLRDPAILVGTFDRPNLVYRVVPRVDTRAQVLADSATPSPSGRHRLLHQP